MKKFRPDIEGLRAVAILLVIAAHAGVPWLAGGFVGVDVFFVLSGFLITGLLVNEISETGRLRFLDFYLRRLRRLLPALLIMLVVVCTATWFLLAPTNQATQSISAGMAALWLSNFHFALTNLDYFSPASETNLFLHTWSLGVEEQFYLVWPALLIWLLGRKGAHNLARLKIGMLVVVAVSLAASITLTYKEPLLAFYMMPMRAWQFAVGALVWLHFKRPAAAKEPWPTSQRRTLFVLGWLGLLAITISGLVLHPRMPYPGAWALIPTLGTAATLAAGSTGSRSFAVGRFLAWSPLQKIGRLSYAWYLWHWPVLLLGHALTGSHSPGYRVIWVALSLLLAFISYVAIEAPLRSSRIWLKRPRMALLASIGLMVLASGLSARWYVHAENQLQSARMQRYAAAHHDAPVIYKMGCDEWYYSSAVRICEFGPRDATNTVVLMGDSHVGQWFPAVASAFQAPRWRLLVVTKSSCPMVDEPFFYARIGREYTECAEWRKDALREVTALKPDLLIFGSAQYDFTQAQWISGTARLLDLLSSNADRIYILRDTPSLPFDGPDCLLAHANRPRWLNEIYTCNASAEDNRATQIFSWLSEASSRYANVSMLDMNRYVCPDGTCSAELNGHIVFRDSQHLTGSFAGSLGPALQTRLGSIDESEQ